MRDKLILWNYRSRLAALISKVCKKLVQHVLVYLDGFAILKTTLALELNPTLGMALRFSFSYELIKGIIYTHRVV